jgi:hypothetical protein
MIALFSIIRALLLGKQSPPGSGCGSERRDAFSGRGKLIGSLFIHFFISVHLPPTIYRHWFPIVPFYRQLVQQLALQLIPPMPSLRGLDLALALALLFL